MGSQFLTTALVLDSIVVNATAQVLEFALYESPTGGTAQWVEQHTVSVNNGKFAVALGQGTKVSSSPANATFDEVVLDAEKLYIGIKVDDGTGTFIELAGNQFVSTSTIASAGCNVLIDAGVWKLDQVVAGAVATCAAYCIRLN